MVRVCLIPTGRPRRLLARTVPEHIIITAEKMRREGFPWREIAFE